MSKAELLAAVWMVNHPEDFREKGQQATIEDYIQQFDFFVQNFQGIIGSLNNN